MNCSLKQRVIDKLVDKGAAVITPGGIKPSGAITSIKTKFEESVLEIMQETPKIHKIPFSVLQYNAVDGNFTFNEPLIEAIEGAVSSSSVDSFPNLQFNGVTSSDTTIDNILDASRIDAYINLRKKLYADLTQRRITLQSRLNSGYISAEEYNDIGNQLVDIQHDLDLIEEQLTTLRSTPKLSFILINAKEDFRIIEEFIEGKQHVNLNDIRELVSFYKRLGSLENNPIFLKEDIYTETGELDPEKTKYIEEHLAPLRVAIEKLEAKIEYRQKEIAMGIITSNLSYQELFKDNPKSFEELLYTNEGLPDASFIDAYLMDITNGIFSSNGILPQVMQMKLDAKMAEYNVHLAKFKKEMGDMLPKVEKEMRALGKTWLDFMNKTKSGLRQEGLISPIEKEFYSLISKAEREFREAERRANANPNDRHTILQNAVNTFKKALSGKAEALNVDLIPELSNTPTTEQIAYKNSLIKRFGEVAYDRFVKEQRKKLNIYEARLKIYTDRLMEQEGVQNVEDLSDALKDKLKNWENANSPSSANSLFKFNIFIPKDSSFNNSRFADIENNATLKSFYKLLETNNDLMYNMLPRDKQKELGTLGLLQVERTFWDTLADPNISILEKISKVFKEILDFIVKSVKKDIRNYTTSIKVDPATGERKYKINDSWFNTNKSQIKDIMVEYEVKVKKMLNLPQSETLYGKTFNISTNTEVKSILAEILGTTPSDTELSNRLGQSLSNIDLSKALYESISDMVMANQSMDLPKVMLLQMHQITAYAARQDALPEIETLKRYYEGIRTKEGKTRDNAIKQMDSWFNRVVLDNYEVNNEMDALDEKMKDVKLTKADKLKVAELEGMISMLEEELTKVKSDRDKLYLERKIKTLREKRDSTGFTWSLSALVNRVFELIRFKGLGYNVNASITNYAEGQLSNFLAGEKGVYFNSEQLKRANYISLGSTVNTLSFGWINNKKVVNLMKKFDVQQDASNDLQKASRESSLNKLNNLGPYEITKRTEFLNQSPVLIAMMLNKTITGKSGNESTLWDALDADGNLLEDFRTDENIAAWENNTSEEFYTWKSKVNKAIIDIHGDYHDTHGNMASEYTLGKMLLTFKRWFVRMFYNRLGQEQIDLESGQMKAKGRYRSMTRGQWLLAGTVVGATISPLLAVIGAGLGIAAGYKFGIHTNESLLSDFTQNIKVLGWNMLRLPVNKLAFFTPNEVMKSRDFEYEGMDLVDRNNMKANIAELSFYLALCGVGLALRAMASADDEDDPILTYLINKNNQLLGQSSLYLNPMQSLNIFSEVALLKHFTETGEFVAELNKYFQGEDVSLWNKGAKAFFLPSIVRSGWLGLEASSVRVFEEWGYDPFFIPEEKSAKQDSKAIKEDIAEDIEDSSLPEDKKAAALKTLDKATKKRKGESEVNKLKRLEQIEDDLRESLIPE